MAFSIVYSPFSVFLFLNPPTLLITLLQRNHGPTKKPTRAQIHRHYSCCKTCRMLSCLHVFLDLDPDRDRIVSAVTKKPKPTGSNTAILLLT